MRPWARKLVKGTLILVGGSVLVLFAGIVGFRLLVTQLPSYQKDLQAWVNDTLGVRLTFARMDARWGWRGPELTFREASVAAADDATPFLTARSASVSMGPIALLARLVTARELGIDRLTFEGTELTLVKTPDGAFRVQGAPDSAARADFGLNVPPDVEVEVRASRVLYLDQSRGLAWDFQDVAGSMRRDAGSLLLDARVRPPSDFARSIEITAQGFITSGGSAGERQFTGDWRVSADARGVDLAVASRLLPSTNVLPQSGQGDVAVWVEWQAGVPVGGNVSLELADVDFPGVAGAGTSRYERIGFTADWQRSDTAWSVALRDLAVVHAGSAWPSGTAAEIEIEHGAGADADLERFALRSDFVRLEDLTPLLAPLPSSRLGDAWVELAPRGDLTNVDVQLARTADDGIDYSVSSEFAGFGIAQVGDLPGFSAMSGAVRADSRSGRVELKTAAAGLDWPALFRAPFEITELNGIVVWRQAQDALRIVSDDLVLATRDASSRTNLELTFPMEDGASPRLDLEAAITGFDLGAVSRYLPAPKMPPTVVAWLDGALQGGRANSANVTFFGPVQAFPFDGGEGEFRAVVDLEGGDLAFIRDWPHAEELDGAVEFVNASFAARGSGRVLGNRTADVRVGIGDLRNAVLTIQADTIGPLGEVLAFLKGAPLIARYLGPDFARLDAPNGTGEVGFDLALPVLDMPAFRLTASLGIIDGELAYRGFGPHATEIQGGLELRDGALHGEGIEAIFLDGPVTARVGAPSTPGYRTRLDLEGEVTIDAVIDAFNLPFSEQLAGQTSWQGSLLIPDAGAVRAPPKITVDSNLSGVALRFPDPFAKPPGEPVNLQIGMTFPAGGGLEMEGHLGPSRRFAAQFDPEPNGVEGKFAFRRAALELGGGLPELRHDRGVTVGGSVPVLRVDDWLPLAKAAAAGGVGNGGGFGAGFAGADLEVADFSAFGQELGSTKISTRRRTDDWQIELDSGPIAGTVLVPVDLDRDPQIVAVMRRLYLSVGEGLGGRSLDPRQFPGLQLHADEFAIGARQLGRLDAEILSDPLGLRLASFESSSESFGAQGSGGWFTGADGDTTRFAVSVSSSDVGMTLQALGFDPIIEAESAEITASLYWPGPPTGDWMAHVGGDLAIKAGKGTLNDVQPGAGRVVGLLSFSALPRRLALDFRDVFNRGFVFDDINADFVVVDGNAYTDNLKLTGPIADIGVIGRTGLRDHDYRQQAVVTAEPSKMLPTVGALLGGAGVGAAILIFTRIFKKPLSGIGRASYCLTGSWQEPMVERLTQEQLENGEICAELPPDGALAKPAEVAAR
jgi:uncharacterized protein (TIGR02099 family)